MVALHLSLWQQHRLQNNLNLLGQPKQWDVTKHEPCSSLADSICMLCIYLITISEAVTIYCYLNISDGSLRVFFNYICGL